MKGNQKRIQKTLIAAVIACSFTKPALAATIVVNNGADSVVGCTLREAVQSVMNGTLAFGCSDSGVPFGVNDTIEFDLDTPVTIQLASSLPTINKDLIINGPTQDQLTINANGRPWVFQVSDAEIGINDISLIGGVSLDNADNSNINRTVIIANASDCAISGSDADNLTIQNSQITSNGGSGVCSSDANVLNIVQTEISSNRNGIEVSRVNSFRIANSVVSDNGSKGVVASKIFNKLDIIGTTIAGNSNAGLDIEESGTVTILGSTISRNSNTGGAPTPSVSNSFGIFTSSVIRDSNEVIISNSTISGNDGTLELISNVDVSIGNSSFIKNVGGVALSGETRFKVLNSIFSGNSTLEFSSYNLYTFDPNNPGSVQPEESQFQNNIFGDDSGTIRTFLVPGSIAFEATNGNIFASLPSPFLTSARSINLDDIVGPLTNNGGLTQTHALVPGSVAINSGHPSICEPLDQRGLARVDGQCDIGAFEFKGAVSPAPQPPPPANHRKVGFLSGVLLILVENE